MPLPSPRGQRKPTALDSEDEGGSVLFGSLGCTCGSYFGVNLMVREGGCLGRCRSARKKGGEFDIHDGHFGEEFGSITICLCLGSCGAVYRVNNGAI